MTSLPLILLVVLVAALLLYVIDVQIPRTSHFYQPASYAVAATSVMLVCFAADGEVEPPIPPEPPPVTGDFGGFRPHFQGFGATTRGGRNGPVCKVTTLTIDGNRTFGPSGDFADCTAPRPGCTNSWETCARTVVFNVSGTSTADAQVIIDSPYLTIAGATAPPGGFTLTNARLLIDTHDVYVGHIRVRRPPQWLNTCAIGDSGDGGDNSHVQHVIIDHVTCSWAWNVNNYLQSYPGSGNVLLTDSLIYEGLWDNAAGGIGAGVGGDSTIVRNVVAHHWSRQPVWGSATRIILANNIAYNGTDIGQGDSALPANYGDLDGDGNVGALTEAMVLWNLVIPGPDSGQPRGFFGFSKKQASLDAGSKTFFEGNTGPGVTSANGDGQWVATVCGNYGVQYTNVATCGPSSNMRSNDVMSWWGAFNMGTLTSNVRDAVLANAGARPKDRDSADARVIADVVEGDGTHYVNWEYIQNQYGGMPVVPTNTRDVVLPANPNDAGTCGMYADGAARSRFDCFLEHDPAFGARRLETWPAGGEGR